MTPVTGRGVTVTSVLSAVWAVGFYLIKLRRPRVAHKIPAIIHGASTLSLHLSETAQHLVVWISVSRRERNEVNLS